MNRLHQPQHIGFTCPVSRKIRACISRPASGKNNNYTPLRLEHPAKPGLAYMEDTVQIGGDGFAPFVRIVLPKRTDRPLQGSRADDNIEAAEALNMFLDHPHHALKGNHICNLPTDIRRTAPPDACLAPSTPFFSSLAPPALFGKNGLRAPGDPRVKNMRMIRKTQ